MSKLIYSKNKIKLELLLISFKDENSIYFVYSPHLDLTGYGHTRDEAKKSFNIALDDFLEYTIEMDTLPKVLIKLGWKLESKTKRRFVLPSITELFSKNKEIVRILDNYAGKFEQKKVDFPILA